MRELCQLARCRVGGGVRSADDALAWLDAGAEKVVLGTAAVPKVLEALPPDRVVAALDAWEGEVVVKGWTEATGCTVLEAMESLSGLAGGFLVTFVEGEGMEAGFPGDQVPGLVATAGGAFVTVAGGITKAEEIAWLDRQGADAQVGMALYKGTLGLAEALCAPLTTEREDGLWPTVVADEGERTLGLAWSSAESVSAALDEGRGVYHSRTRGLWRKGESSGAVQHLLGVELDCDRDALRFRVRQEGAGFCHTGSWSCFGPGRGVPALERTIEARRREGDADSLTSRLLEDPRLLEGKLVEEAREVARAVDRDHVVREGADVLYFLSVALARAGVSLSDVEEELDRRARRVTRRRPSPPKEEP